MAQVVASPPLRPTPVAPPEAVADQLNAEAGERKRIDVLANDRNIPSTVGASQLRVEGRPECGRAQIEGRYIIYQAGNECVGREIKFGYSVNVDSEWIPALILIMVVAPGGPCKFPDEQWKAVKITGGRFEKNNAPSGIIDFVELIDEPEFTVTPFCIMTEGVPITAVDRFFNTMPEPQRLEQFPELADARSGASAYSPTGQVQARASRRMAVAFAAKAGERVSRTLELPTLNQIVAAAWELYAKIEDDADAATYIVGIRTPGAYLQWTSTQCGNEAYWALGPARDGRLIKLCVAQTRPDRMGFRLLVK